MKKAITVLFVLLVLFAFTGCATKSNNVSKQGDLEDWWNNPPEDTEELHYEVGYANGGNLQISRDWAKANANSAIAQYIKRSVKDITETYAQSAGVQATNNMQALQAYENVSQQIAQASIRGVKYKFAPQEDGGVYVLASIPIENLVEELQAMAKETFERNGASVEALDAMNSAIEKNFK